MSWHSSWPKMHKLYDFAARELALPSSVARSVVGSPSVVCQIFALLLGGFCNRKSGGVAPARRSHGTAAQPPTWFMSVQSFKYPSISSIPFYPKISKRNGPSLVSAPSSTTARGRGGRAPSAPPAPTYHVPTVTVLFSK